jgi:hypothetical protein
MMRTLHVATLAAVLSLAAPAFAATSKGAKCPAGKVKAHGHCVDACPTDHRFESTDCECPAGYGKILTGTGAGECKRLVCTVGGSIKSPSLCDCPRGYAKKKGAKGETRCVVANAAAPR